MTEGIQPENSPNQTMTLDSQRFSAVVAREFSGKARFVFVRQVAGTYASQLAGVAISLFTTSVIARVLGPEGRGQFAVAMAVGVLGVQSGNLGLHASNNYYAAKRPHLLASLLGNSLVVSLGLGSLGAAGAGLAFSLWPNLAPVHGKLLALGLAWIPIGLAYLLTVNLLVGIQRVRAYNGIELAKRILNLLIILAVMEMQAISAESLFVASALAQVACTVLAVSELRKFTSVAPLPSLLLFRQSFGLGAKAYLVAFLAFLVLRADLLMVKYMMGAEQAGYYAVAGSMADYILLLPAAIATVLFPKLSAMPAGKGGLRWANKVALGTALLLLPVVLLAALLAHPIIHLLFGNAFQPAATAFVLLMPGVFFLGIETVIVQYLNSLGFPRSVIVAWFIACALNIGVNFWAIPKFGIAGASVVSSVCYSLMAVLILGILRRQELAVALPAAETDQ